MHPKYLDRSGLITLWREALLAQKVLEGKTKGYNNKIQKYMRSHVNDRHISLFYFFREYV